MSETTYTAIAGRAVLIGKSPDGDSVRFVPDEPALLRSLLHGERVRASSDGSVQLRFDGIDAPELHYEGAAQPRGAAARDALLQRLGFSDVAIGPDGVTVTDAVPPTVPIVVLARLVEVNGRPVAVVYAGDGAALLGASSGAGIELTADLLGRSVNVWEVANGVVYPLVYTSTSPGLRAVFVDAARAARAAGEGVWSIDSTASFPVSDVRDVGPHGVLIWPKLFRRAIDFLRGTGTGPTLPGWLAAHPLLDDDVIVQSGAADGTGGVPVPLHTLLEQAGQQVRLLPDLLDLVVVEREATAPGAPRG